MRGTRSSASGEADLRRSITRHYDSLALLYRAFWGEHIHHGLWLAPRDSARRAQLQLVDHLARRAGIGRRERVLDVGCGYGASGRWLSARLGCQVTGITISDAQARLVQRRNARRGARIAVVRADAAAIPLSDRSFDLVWVIECVEHLADKRRFVREVHRLLRPGGRLALCSWQRGEGGAGREALVEAVCEAFLCPSLASDAEYRDWCEAAGLKVRCAEDLTPRVAATWDVLRRRLERPWLAPFKRLLSADVRRFVEGFATIAQAYANGAMKYGLLVAVKP